MRSKYLNQENGGNKVTEILMRSAVAPKESWGARSVKYMLKRESEDLEKLKYSMINEDYKQILKSPISGGTDLHGYEHTASRLYWKAHGNRYHKSHVRLNNNIEIPEDKDIWDPFK